MSSTFLMQIISVYEVSVKRPLLRDGFKQQGRCGLIDLLDAPIQSSWFVNERREVRADWNLYSAKPLAQRRKSVVSCFFQEFRDIIRQQIVSDLNKLSVNTLS